MFLGARDTICRNHPVIIFEHTGDPNFVPKVRFEFSIISFPTLRIQLQVEANFHLSLEEKEFNIFQFLLKEGYNSICLLPPLFENVMVMHSSTKPYGSDTHFRKRPLDLNGLLFQAQKNPTADPRMKNMNRFIGNNYG